MGSRLLGIQMAAAKCAEETACYKIDDISVFTFAEQKLYLNAIAANIFFLICKRVKLMDFVFLLCITARVDITFSLGAFLTC